LETVRSLPPPGRNMPSTEWIRQGGKHSMARRIRKFRMRHKSNCAAGTVGLVHHALAAGRSGAGKPSLTVFCCNLAVSHNISASGASSRDLDDQELPPWNLKAPNHRSSNRSSSATC
jgi:hypothetical protein